MFFSKKIVSTFLLCCLSSTCLSPLVLQVASLLCTNLGKPPSIHTAFTWNAHRLTKLLLASHLLASSRSLTLASPSSSRPVLLPLHDRLSGFPMRKPPVQRHLFLQSAPLHQEKHERQVPLAQLGHQLHQPVQALPPPGPSERVTAVKDIAHHLRRGGGGEGQSAGQRAHELKVALCGA